jgi:hypothetical protein
MEDSVTDFMDFEDRVIDEEKHISHVNVSDGAKRAPPKTFNVMNTTTEA